MVIYGTYFRNSKKYEMYYSYEFDKSPKGKTGFKILTLGVKHVRDFFSLGNRIVIEHTSLTTITIIGSESLTNFDP